MPVERFCFCKIRILLIRFMWRRMVMLLWRMEHAPKLPQVEVGFGKMALYPMVLYSELPLVELSQHTLRRPANAASLSASWNPGHLHIYPERCYRRSIRSNILFQASGV